MSTAPVVVMGASRESDDALSKVASKIDKSGVTQFEDAKKENYATNPYKKRNVDPDDKMMRINAAEHKPKRTGNIYSVYKKDGDTSLPDFVSAINND